MLELHGFHPLSVCGTDRDQTLPKSRTQLARPAGSATIHIVTLSGRGPAKQRIAIPVFGN
jgi:hypothetical protein